MELKSRLLDKEFLLVKDVVSILEYSRSAVYELILTGELKSYRLSERRIRVMPSDLLAYVQKKGEEKMSAPIEASKIKKFQPLNIGDCYSVNEAVELFGKGRDAIYSYFKRVGISKISKGKEVYYSKIEVDKLYHQFTGPKYVGHDKERERNIKIGQKDIMLMQYPVPYP